MKFANYALFKNEHRKFGIEYAVKHSAKLGFDSVEFLARYTDDPLLFKNIGEALEAKKLVDSYGISVCCYSMLAKLSLYDREKSLDCVLHNVECAAALGSPYFHHTIIPEDFYPTPRLTYDEAFELVFEKAERVVEHCQKYGITCLYEPQGVYMNGVDGLSKFYYEMKKRHANVGICGDVGNSLWVDVLPEDVFAALSKEIKHIHIKDCLVKDAPDAEAYESTLAGLGIAEVLPGKGSIDFRKLFGYLENYTGVVSMEVDCSDDEMKKSIEYIKTCFNEVK